MPDLARLRYVFDAVATIKRALHGRVPLIGFSGSPFTLACYMIEGGGSDDDFAVVRRMAAARPDLLQHLVDVNATAVAAYLNEQIRAGADAVMVFDTWGGLLPAAAYRRFSLATMRAVLAGLAPAPDGRRVPTILFTKGGGVWLDDLAESGADAVGLDWTMDLGEARRRVGSRVALQGNLDPLVLTTDPRPSPARRRPSCWPPAPRPGTSSTSATASSRALRRKTSPRWSRRCTPCRAGNARRRPANRCRARKGLDKRSFAGPDSQLCTSPGPRESNGVPRMRPRARAAQLLEEQEEKSGPTILWENRPSCGRHAFAPCQAPYAQSYPHPMCIVSRAPCK